MRLQSSATQREILSKTGISSVEELMYADLRRVGWDKSDAFYAAFHDLYSDYPMSQQKKLLKSFEGNPAIQQRIMKTVKDDNGMIPLDELAKETSKEKILSDLVLARSKTKPGTKEWIDITSKIADYAKIKQDDIKTDEQPIRYHLPVHYPRTCRDCLIYQNGKQIK